ncbi:MAG: helix-turn-helix domain-containing protein [Saprospiraceae bacterium]|nr:helix-turn-helix domain-containing protein [Saprospiraceae bacterium]
MNMTTNIIIKPSREDQKLAKESVRILSTFHKQNMAKGSLVQLFMEDKTNVKVVIPRSVYQLMETILEFMSQGKAISILPAETELTTQQAAEMLHVSRPHIVKLLESGEIPFIKVGSHRRIRLQDLQSYRQKLQKKQQFAMEKLAKQGQDLSLGY